MASESEIEKLQIRISQLEDQLKSLRHPQAEITADDLKAHRKVQEALFGGCSGCLTECTRCLGPCGVCQVLCIANCLTNCSLPCNTECTCGPCLQQFRPQSGGLGRFGGLGS